MKAVTPMFCRPTELIIPASVCQRRGAALPAIGSRERPFVTIAPRLLRSTILSNSIPYPNVPEAANTGFRSWIPQSVMASRESFIRASFVDSRAGDSRCFGNGQLLCSLANQVPRFADVLLGCLEIAYGKAKHKLTVEHCMREEGLARRVHVGEEPLIEHIVSAI